MWVDGDEMSCGYIDPGNAGIPPGDGVHSHMIERKAREGREATGAGALSERTSHDVV